MIHQIQPHALVVFKTGANGNEDFITGEREMGSLAPVFKSVGLPKKGTGRCRFFLGEQ